MADPNVILDDGHSVLYRGGLRVMKATGDTSTSADNALIEALWRACRTMKVMVPRKGADTALEDVRRLGLRL